MVNRYSSTSTHPYPIEKALRDQVLATSLATLESSLGTSTLLNHLSKLDLAGDQLRHLKLVA